MPMRVIAGEYRHRKLLYPENNVNIRPTKDRIREAFFSSLGDIEGKSFLDLYAGCGSMGIEAISRGARYSTFVDMNNESISYVRKNIDSLHINDKAEILKMMDEVALAKFKKGILAIETKRDIEINPLWDVKIKEYHYGEIKVIVLRK